ncbi:MAG: RNA methyltransferase [Bacteroidetes bacterium]|nr:RNA methyltransferase [Bacteroidota bacterium]
MPTESRIKKLENVLRNRLFNLTLVLENINDPHNVSAIFRTADAVGISVVNLVYTNEKFPKLGRKSSASANKWVDKKSFNSPKKCITSLKKKGFKIYATKLDKNSKSIFDFKISEKTAIVFGNEHSGVSEEIQNLVDGTIYIPMRGMVQSLNVSVSCGIILYEILKQILMNQINIYKLNEIQIKRMLKKWLKK